MKNFLLFNQLFGTEGSPNQTGETLTRENRIGLMSYLRRTLMLLFAVLVMSMANVGLAWGTEVTWSSANQSALPEYIGNTSVVACSGDHIAFNGSNSSAVLRMSVNDGAYVTLSTTSSYKITSITIYVSGSNNSPYGLTCTNTGAWLPSGCWQNISSSPATNMTANSTSSMSTGKSYKFTPGTATAGASYSIYTYKASPGSGTRSDWNSITVTYESVGGGATTYDVNIEDLSNGSITAIPTSQEEGEDVTLTVSPSTGYELSGDISVTGDESDDNITATDNGNGTWTFEMPAEDVTVGASFSLIDYAVSKTLTNCAVKAGSTAIPSTMNYGDDLSTIIEPTTGNLLPGSITVSGVTSYTWNALTGALTLTDVTGNVSISISAAAPQTGTGTTVTYSLVTSGSTAATYSTGVFTGILSDGTANKNTIVASKVLSGGNGVAVQSDKNTPKNSRTAGITCSTADFNAASSPYAEFTFNVVDGYTFTPTAISVPVMPITYNAYFTAIVTDGSSTWTSATSECTQGAPATINATPSGGSALTGTVHIRVFCHNQATAAKGFRFGTGNVTITGTVAAAAGCTDVAAPTELSCTNIWSNNLTFGWTAALNADHYTATLYSDAECNTQVKQNTSISGTSTTFNGIAPNTTYYCKVQSHGNGSTYCANGGTTATAASGKTLVARIFKSGEYVYFKDASGPLPFMGGSQYWKQSGGDLCAYFYDDAEPTQNSAWATALTMVSGSNWNEANNIYRIIVPQLSSEDHEWTGVIFTRGSAGSSWTFDPEAGFWEQTEDQQPALSYNLFKINNDAADGKWKGTWARYTENPALVGDFNNWEPTANVFGNYSSNVGNTLFTLNEASTNYKFKILDGEKEWSYDASSAGWTITNTTTTSQQLYDNNDVSNITSTEVGEYEMKYNKNTHTFIAAYYPKERLTKNTILYFDARRETNWKSAAFHTKFYFKKHDKDEELDVSPSYWFGESPVDNADDNWVYYITLPNCDNIGKVQLMRINPNNHGEQWCYSNMVSAGTRSSVIQNCLIEEVGKEDVCSPWNPGWQIYCPPTTSETFTDNSTSVIAGTSGDGTSGNPYLVPTTGTINVQASASKAVNDGNMTINYDFKVGGSSEQAGEGNMYSKGSLSNNTTYTMSVDAYTVYNLDDSKNSTKHTPTALYYKALDVYTISYNKGSNGTGDNTTAEKIYGISKTLLGATFTREGYTQTGWATEDGGSKVYELSGSYTANAAANLYPVWTAKTYTISYNAGTNGSGTKDSESKTHGVSFTLPGSTFTYIGHAQDGWATSDGGSKDYNLGGSYTTDAAQEFFPHWKCNTPTISFASATNTVTITIPNGTKVYYTTDGSTPDDEDTEYTEAFTIDADCTVKAIAIQSGCTDSEVASEDCTYSGGGGDCEYSVIAEAVLNGTGTTSTLEGGTLLVSGLNDSGPYKLNGKPSWFGMKLSKNLQVGDSIIFKVKVGDWWAGKSADNVPIVVFAGKNLDKEIYRTSAIAKATDNYYVRFVVTQTMIDSYGLTDTVMIWRSEANDESCTECCTQNHKMYSMQVKHCTPSCSTPSAPTSPTNGATTYNTQAVSWTDASNEKWDVIVSESSSTPDAGDTPTASDLTSKSYTFTGLTASTTYYWWVRSVCDASHKSAWVAGSSFTTSAAPTLYTVTFNSNGGSAVSPIEQASEGASITLPTPTKSGYAFDGWYTSGGTKAGDGGDSYNPGADITLYAQWQSTDCDAGGTTTLVDIDFKDAAWSDKTFSQGNTDTEDLIKGVYFWCKDATKHFSLEDNTSKGLTFPADNMSSNNRYFCIPITGINSRNKQITVTLKHGYSSSTASFKYYYNDGRTEWVDASAGSGTSVSDAQKSDTEITFTLNNSGKGLTNTAGHLFIGRNSSSFTNIYGVTVTTPGAAGTCYYVTYNGNGATGGYTTDEAAYASGDEATAATNSFTRTGYTFGGWATSKANADAGTKNYDEGDAIAISGNITLYAIWQAAGYTLAWDSNGGSALSGTYSSGSLADGATITAPNDPTRANYTFDSWNTAADGSGNAFTGTMPAANTTYYAVWKNTLTLKTGSQGSESDKSPTVFLDGSSLNGFSAHKAAGYTLQGYYTAATGGTKVLNADGSFAASNIARFVTSGKWSRTTGDTILVAQWESSYLLKWNLQLNKAEDAISTTSKESATARVTTASMTNLTNNGGLTITSSKKSDLTSMIETPINLSGAESKYMSVSFDVTAGYQLLPSAVKVVVQPVGNGENKYAKLILEDENSHSISTVVTCEGTEKGKKTTVTLSNAGGTVFTGTVTLKILVYNASGESTTNNCYRLGSPIQIDGAIEAACNLPSYEGLEYDQTEYTVGVDEASAIRVTGGSADTYQWKWNSTNDRSTGTVVGTNNASYTPLITISEVGTRYYWCELKNDDCDGVVKTPVVAVTVSSAVTATTVTWSDPENEPNYGGGGYVIRATVDQTEWGGTLGESNLVAPAGIHITNVATGTDDGKQYIEATFDVTTAFDRDENEVIVFGLTHDAVTGYSAISVTDTIDYDACSGGEEGSAAIALTSAIHDEGSGNAPRYWFETSGVGRVFGLNYGKATLGTSSDATFNTEGYSYVASSTSQRWVFQPYVEGVTKIRIYIKSATNTLRVLSIGKNASWQDQSGKYSNIAVDTIIYSNDKTTGLDNNQKGYAEIQFSSALTKDNYYMFTMSSSSTYIYGVTLYSGSVGDGGNLATSLTFADPGPIAADASTANFQNIASKSGENSNTLGTITYSSNNDAATVNATTGEVSIHAKETAQVVTITATLSASGCYQGATATYTINVAADACDEPSGSIELTTGSATKCSGESVILTMTGFTSGAIVEWYNGDTKVNGAPGYTIVTSGSTSTLETSNAGTYSAIAKVDGGCPSGAGRTNSITISDISVDASATKIVDKWYVKNGRLTPDIALWQLSEGATLDEVTIERNVSGEGSLGLTSSDFVARDGIVYLSGKEPSANETGADVEYTLTLTVKDACDGEHEMTEKTITLTHQKNTDKHVLAFVVNGTAKGGFTDGITAAQTTSVGLYNAIAAQFDVLATNIYATDDEKKLKEYYSQFDILCITDYPNTQTKGANSKSYVDAIGSLIDIRPILTMEAFVSKLENWKVKGISGNPKSPTTRQYTMDLQCKDHEIFAGTKLTKVGEGDDAMYRVSMVCDTLEDYKTLDATYGDGAHAEKDGYNYGGKPALQGFTFSQAMEDADLLPLGLIDDGAGNDLQVGLERQHNMEARLMVLGINSYAMERLADDGERIVINALKYLMKKSYEDIADCSTSFVGGAEDDTKNWNNPDNWTGNTVPLPSQKVRILAECEVSSTVHALDVLIVTDGKYNHGSDNAAGKLTIKENGALIVGGKIQAASAPAYNRPRATTPDKLLIETSSTNQAALIFDNEEGETQATVNYHSKGYNDGDFYQFQYFAIPMDYVAINPVFADEANGVQIYTYAWDEPSNDWERRGYYSGFSAFEGLAITTTSDSQMDYTLTGNLASTAEREITLTHGGGGDNMIGNSWMAPINIASLVDAFAEDENVEKTVYIYCAGNDSVSGGDGVDINETVEEIAGQWLSIPMGLTTFPGWGGLKVIPAMQAYLIKATGETTLTLNYDEMVRSTAETALNEKLRAPKRRTVHNEDKTLTRLRVADSRTHTDLYFVEGDVFSDAFDNGWEATYMPNEGASPQFYAMGVKGKMAVLATDDFEGTVVGFEPGKETAYTISFSGAGNGYYLNDVKTQASTLIIDGEAYSFEYEAGDDANRFYISRTPLGAPAITTGINNPDAAAPKVLKVIYNDKLYIIRGGKVYSADGQVVK